MSSIDQSGSCHCGAVAYHVKGNVAFNAYCHCRNCTRNRGVAPIHLIGVAPATSFEIKKGADNVTVYDHGQHVTRAFCKTCGCIVSQGPANPTPGSPADFRAVAPVTFQIDGPLPEAYRPKAHVNYENRFMDYNDDLPKFKTFPGPEGVLLTNCGEEIKK